MMTILRWLNSVSPELFFPFAVHINLLIMTRIFAGNKLLNKNVRGQSEKNGQQLSVEIYSVLSLGIPRYLSARTNVEHVHFAQEM